jgi:hypothetical protein
MWLSREIPAVAYEGDGRLSRWQRLRRWLGKCWDVIGSVGSSPLNYRSNLDYDPALSATFFAKSKNLKYFYSRDVQNIRGHQKKKKLKLYSVIPFCFLLSQVVPPSVELLAEEKYRRWLGERFEESTRQLCALAHHARPAVSQLAVVTLMNLMQAQHRRATSNPEGDTYKVLFHYTVP